jgi:large subunit ribosomal protein L24
MLRIKKNDKVIVTTGKDKGKTGKVLHVFPDTRRAVVENINMVKKAKRRTQQDQQGGIIEIEAPIHLSNLMLTDKKGKAVRYSVKTLKDGGKERISRKSSEVI